MNHILTHLLAGGRTLWGPMGSDISSPETGDALNLAGILNTLDGVVDTPGRLLVMTSNHPEKLDPALIRPGRIDKMFHLSYMVGEQAHAPIHPPESRISERIEKDLYQNLKGGTWHLLFMAGLPHDGALLPAGAWVGLSSFGALKLTFKL